MSVSIRYYLKHSLFKKMPNKFAFPLVIVLLSVTIIGTTLIYKFTSESEKVKNFAWDQIIKSYGVPMDDLPTGLVYELGGTIENISSNKIRISKNDEIKDFDTSYAQFPIVSSFDSFEQWPLNIIDSEGKSDFKVGDEVILIERATLSTKNPTIGWVIKVRK